MLARTFAQMMGFAGGYAILRHIPGTSCYYARTYSVITELRRDRPEDEMPCDGPELARRRVRPGDGGAPRSPDGSQTHGSDLRGIVAPDDDILVDGIDEALRRAGRQDIIRVGAGSTPKGMEMVKAGTLHAITFQPPQADGALPDEDRRGLVQRPGHPADQLPSEAHHHAGQRRRLHLQEAGVSPVSLDGLTRAVLAQSDAEVDRFFEDAYVNFLSAEMVTPEVFRGFSIEVLSTLIHIMKMNDMDEQRAAQRLRKPLQEPLQPEDAPQRDGMDEAALAQRVIRALARERREESPIDRIIRYVTRNYAEQLSLKVLAAQFDISAPYLGRLFHDAVGKPFATYLNEIRLRKAEELLRFTALKANEVAARIGYSNANYFYTLFKKYKGYYPSESRSRACPDDEPPTSRADPVVHSLKQK